MVTICSKSKKNTQECMHYTVHICTCTCMYVLDLLYVKNLSLSAENKKSINAVQQCSVENQKGAMILYRLGVAIAPFWFLTEHRYIEITPFGSQLTLTIIYAYI